MGARYDVVVVTDPRLVGGGNKSLAQEIRAHAAAGYRTGLFPMAGPSRGGPRPIDVSLRELLDDGRLELIPPDQPVDAGLVIGRGPSMFGVDQRTTPQLRAEHWLIVANAYNTDAAVSNMRYDADQMAARAAEHFGHAWTWVPLSKIVRRALKGAHPQLNLAPFDWSNIIDLDEWRLERPDQLPHPIRLGRHARDAPAKWPTSAEEILQSLPPGPDFEIHVMGGARTPRAILGDIPDNWQVFTFGAMSPREFLQHVDVFSYYHHPKWEEAFGRSVLEAIATGALAVLPPAFESTFGAAATYTEPAGVRDIVQGFGADPDAVRAQRARAEQVLREEFSHASHVNRLRDLIGRPRPATRVASVDPQVTPAAGPAPGSHFPAPPASIRPDLAATRTGGRRVLFFTDNGHGLGHVTRLMAYAKRLPADVEPFFLTMSEAYRLVAKQGFAVEYFPSPKKMQFQPMDKPYWEQIAKVRLQRTLRRLRPHAVVIDHVNPPTVVRELREEFPNTEFIWSRRGLWRQFRKPAGLRMGDAFRHIIEPMDLAAAVDLGFTTRQSDNVHYVPPVSLVDRSEVLPAAGARAALGLPVDDEVVLLSLSADTTEQLVALMVRIRSVLSDVAGRPVTVFAPRHALHGSLAAPEGVVMEAVYPVARYARAFDAAIATSGYNSFHELVHLQVPSLFIARDTGTLDDQPRRAAHAGVAGFGLSADSVDGPGFEHAAEALMDPRRRRRMQLAAAEVFPDNGAFAAADHIATIARDAGREAQ